MPCTEWPTTEKVVAQVLKTAGKYANAKNWERYSLDHRGAIVGIEVAEDE